MNTFAKIVATKANWKLCQNLRWSFFRKLLLASETNSEFCQTSKVEFFAKIVKNQKPFTIFVKTSTLDISEGSEYAFELAFKVKDVPF